MSYYLIVFNNLEGFDSNQIHNVVTHISTVTDWWHYLPNVYVISTTSSSKYISDRIITSFQGLSFLVIKVDISDYNGVLNKDAWEWFSQKNNQNLKLKVMSSRATNSSPLLDLLSGIPKSNTPSLSTGEVSDLLSDILGLKKK